MSSSWSQSKSSKNGCCLISSTPPKNPILFFASLWMRRFTRSIYSSDTASGESLGLSLIWDSLRASRMPCLSLPLKGRCMSERSYGSHDELIHHDPDSIVVRHKCVVLAKHHLWRHVSWSATRVCTVPRPLYSRDPEVGDVCVPFVVKHDVLWLDVSVDDVFGMDVLQGDQDVRNRELCITQALLISSSENLSLFWHKWYLRSAARRSFITRYR